MPYLKIGSLQWSLGALCVLTGVLLLITPHRLNYLEMEVLRQYLPLYGTVFTLIGMVLIAHVVLRVKVSAARMVLAAGVFSLASIAILFGLAAAWFHALLFIILAPGLALAIVAYQPPELQTTENNLELYPLFITLISFLTASLLLYAAVSGIEFLDFAAHPSHPFFGIAFLAAGLWLVTATLRAAPKPVHSSTSESRLIFPGQKDWSLRFSGAVFLVFSLYLFLEQDHWLLSGYFALFGVHSFVFPWMVRRIKLPPASSVHARLALVLAAAAILPLIFTTAIATEREEQLARSGVLTRQADLAALIADDVRDYIDTRQNALLTLAIQPELISGSPQQRQEQVDLFANLFPDLSFFAFYDRDGRLAAVSGVGSFTTPAQSISGYPIYETASREGRPAFQVVSAGEHPYPVLWFSAPVEQNGTFMGLVAAELTFPQLFEFIERKDQHIPGIVYLVDDQGQTISYPSTEPDVYRIDMSSAPVVQAYLQGAGWGSIHYWHEGDIVLAGYARDSDFGWGVITERSGSKDALVSVYAGREIAVAALGLFVVLSTTAGLVLSGRITRRFRSLSNAAHELSYGNFHAPLPRSSILEIDHLSAAFGEMRSELEKRNKEQEVIEKELLRSKEELELRVFERTGELRDAVEALSKANKLLQIVLENAPAAIWIAGPNGELLQKNSMVDTVWGKGAPLSREIEEYAEYKGWWADTGEPVLPEEWAAARAVREGEAVIGQVIDILRFDGGTSTILNSAAPIIDKDGNKLGAAVVSLDITAQRALEKQARQQAAELEKLLVENQRNRDLLEAIFLTDPGGLAVLAGEDLEFKLVNPAYRQLTPNPSLDIIGKKYDEVWPLQEGFQVKALIRQVLKSGESADSARHKRTYPNGAVRYFSLHLRYLNWENNPAVLSVLWETSSLEYAQRSAENAAEEAQARAVELAYEQARLRTILEHAPAGVVMADTSGSLIMVNRAADEMLGGKVSGDMFGPSVGYTLHHADGSQIESHDLPLPRALHSQKAVEGAEMVVYRENGTKNVLLVNAAPVLTGGEGIAGAVAIMQDITDRKRAEERMQFLMELSDFLSMSQAPEELVRGTAVRLENFYSLQTCALAEVNQEEDELIVYLGIPRSDGAVRTISLSEQPEFYLPLLRSGRMVVVEDIQNERDLPPQYLEWSQKNGTTSFVLIPMMRQGSLAAALFAASEHPRRWEKDELSLMQETAERLWMALENANLLFDLKQSEERFRASVENLLDGFAILKAVREPDDNGNPGKIVDFEYVYVNQAGCRLNRRAREEQVGHTLLELLPGHKNAPVFDEYVKLVENGIPVIKDAEPYEDIFGGNVKLKRVFDMRAVRLNDGFALTWRDVTEKRFMENTLQEYAIQLERSNKELEQFAFVASHDLQEPLRKVKVFSELLMEKTLDKLDGDERDYLSRIQHAVLRMQTMIRDLLAYSRVTTKGQPFNPVELNQVAEEVLYDLDIRISRSQAVVEVGDLPVIEADPMQMRQLFQNLISNALKFHQKDVPPRVRIYSRPSEDSGMIQLVFEDNGIGFDLEHLDRIFQPFERLHGMSRFEGTGMGLAICAKIVQRHHGKINANSQPGEGATFFVSLPLHQPVAHTDHELVRE